jgi:hypothetical protein
MSALRVFVGYDFRATQAYRVCVRSLLAHASVPVDVQPLVLPHLQACGYYRRPMRCDVRGNLWDDISGAPMSTEFAISRFLVPKLADFRGWAAFCDADFLYRADVAALFAFADDRYAVRVVKHNHVPAASVKMGAVAQTRYQRKNWSSLMLFNCAHPAHAGLHGLVNAWPGRDLHAFKWLDDELIGELPETWNWLPGISAAHQDPCAVHFTDGTPDLCGYETAAYADEWWSHTATEDLAA